MFERMTDKARQAINIAQDEARRFDHGYIGTEHLLAALASVNDDTARVVLTVHGVTLLRVQNEIKAIIGQGPGSPTGAIPFTPRVKKVLELSAREMFRLGLNHIGPGELLLGLIREGEGVAMQILVRLGVDPERLRIATIASIMDQPQQPSTDNQPKTLTVGDVYCMANPSAIEVLRRAAMLAQGQGRAMSARDLREAI